MKKEEIEYLRKHFAYSEESPSKLERVIKTTNTSKLGFVGCQDSNGYWQVRFLSKVVKVHKLIWFLFNDKITDGFVIDHIDRDKSNNFIGNLRVVTQSQNCLNSSVATNNKSGITGISWDKVNKKWRVVKIINRKNYHLGRYDNIECAKIALENFTN
jgi:hypothetical protein